MKNKTLGVALMKSVGSGYAALNLAGSIPNLEILEFSPLGDQAQVLVLGDKKEVSRFIIELRTGEIERSASIDNFDEKLLQNYLSLQTATLQKYVLLIEGHFTGDLFSCAQQLSQLGLSVVDFRIFRTTNSPVHLIMTGEDADVIQEWLSSPPPHCQATLIQDLSAGLRQYFQFES